MVSDSRVFRESLVSRLSRDAHLRVVGAASDVAAALPLARTARPRVAVVDFGGGVRQITQLQEERIDVVVVAVPERDDDILECAEAGASGYVTRAASLGEIVGAIEGASRGEMACPPRIAALVFRRVNALAAEQRTPSPSARLTPREQEILGLIGDGLSNKQIARRLLIELSTVKNHLHNIFEKLGVRSRRDAAAVAHAREGDGGHRLAGGF